MFWRAYPFCHDAQDLAEILSEHRFVQAHLHGLLVKCVCSTLAEGPLANGPSARFPLSLLHGVPLGRSKMNLEPMDLTLSAPRQSTPRRGPPPEHDYFMPDEITQAPGEHG